MWTIQPLDEDIVWNCKRQSKSHPNGFGDAEVKAEAPRMRRKPAAKTLFLHVGSQDLPLCHSVKWWVALSLKLAYLLKYTVFTPLRCFHLSGCFFNLFGLTSSQSAVNKRIGHACGVPTVEGPGRPKVSIPFDLNLLFGPIRPTRLFKIAT